jgi:hypothetical protein
LGTPFGMSVLQFIINSAGALMPHNKAESGSGFFTVLDVPTLSSVVPAVIYSTGKMSVFGTNFMTLENDENAYCISEIGGRVSSCTLISATAVRVVSSSSDSPSFYNMTLMFVSGGAAAPFNFVKSPENFVTILANPLISSAAFASSSFGVYIVTLFGSNFITPSQDVGANCTGSIGQLSARSCSIADHRSVTLLVETDPSLLHSFSLTFYAGGITVYASLPVSSFVLSSLLTTFCVCVHWPFFTNFFSDFVDFRIN